MGLRRSNYEIVGVDAQRVVIRDLGPWDAYMTVTNNAERVVEELRGRGMLPDGKRLLYYDSEGQIDEILILGGEFAGFLCGGEP